MKPLPIDKNIPIPPEHSHYTRRVPLPFTLPWAELQVSDSFLVPCAALEQHHMRHLLTIGRMRYEYRLNRKFTTRTVEGGIRVWRTV